LCGGRIPERLLRSQADVECRGVAGAALRWREHELAAALLRRPAKKAQDLTAIEDPPDRLVVEIGG
jgi:hypothetical protein